jgi:hypothetical protein
MKKNRKNINEIGMPLGRTLVVVKKGFIKSVYTDISNSFSRRRGVFMISFDYVKVSGLKRDILTNRFISDNVLLVDLLDSLKTAFGNFHLNYIIDTGIIQFFSSRADETCELRKEYSAVLEKYNQLPGSYVNKGFSRMEFVMLFQLYKKKNSADILFINDNMYRDFISVKN